MNILTDDEILNINPRLAVCSVREIEAAILSKLAEKSEDPVAWMNEYSYDLNSDKQGNWPVEVHTQVSFSSTKPDGVAVSKLYTEDQLLAAQQRTAEACAMMLDDFEVHPADTAVGVLNEHSEAIRNGEWREYL